MGLADLGVVIDGMQNARFLFPATAAKMLRDSLWPLRGQPFCLLPERNGTMGPRRYHGTSTGPRRKTLPRSPNPQRNHGRHAAAALRQKNKNCQHVRRQKVVLAFPAAKSCGAPRK